MARKRLYGETQKRRKKKQTQALKRQSSVTRVQSTHLPAPFQRSGEVSSQDVAFLEAMLDMGVSPYPHSGEAPVRREKFETAHSAATREDKDSFLATMETLDVRPMGEKRRGRPSRPAKAPPAGISALPEGNVAQGDSMPTPAATAASEGSAISAEGKSAPPERKSAPPVTGNAAGYTAALEGNSVETNPSPPGSTLAPRDRAVAPQDRAAALPPGPITGPKTESAKPRREKSQRARAATTFELGEHDAELMAEALREGEFDPKTKFEGAPAPKPRPPAPPQREDSERDPDAELDLHGKSQEEAIRMVQNFLLTSYHRKLRHVLIITGKGHNSGAAGPVLREAVYHWLERNGERFARSFAWAPARHGGEGAIWVVLR